jgi:hypothetical protein
MKPLSYYQNQTISYPVKEHYTTTYYYRKGTLVGMKRQFDDDFEPPKNCVEEKVLDEISYNAHMKHYHEEVKRLQDEFRDDLIEKYKMKKHPKAIQIFNKAWDMGCSQGYEDVELYFQDLIELFQDDKDKCGTNLFGLMSI